MRKIILLFLALFMLNLKLQAQHFFVNTYGSTGDDYVYSIEQTSEGGYIFCGPGNTGLGGYDFWIVKLDSFGAVEWQKGHGGSSDDIPNAIKQTADGGYIVAGRTFSYGVPGGAADAWVIKLDSSGNRLWQKTFGGSGNFDAAYSVMETSDGNYYYLSGWTNSFGAGSYDYWVIKLDTLGNIIWQKSLGSGSYDCAYSSSLSDDDGIVVAGGASVGAGGYDFWIYKLDSSGSAVWQKAFGGTSDDIAFSIDRTSDKGFIVAGFTKSYGAGNQDFWVLKIDSSGNLLWNKTYGGSGLDWAFSIKQTYDGGYIVVGRTETYGIGTDALFLKLDSNGNLEWQRNFGGSALDYAYNVYHTSKGFYLLGVVTASLGAGGYDAGIIEIEPSCFLGGSCPYFAIPSVSVSSPSPTITTTTKTPSTTSCSSYTTTPSSKSPTATRTVYCSYYPAGSVSLTLTKSGSNPVLNWEAPLGSCSVTGYGIYRGNLPISSYDHSAIDCSVLGLTYTDSFSGDNQYYLVVPHNNYLEGSYGTDSTGKERPIGSSQCKPRCLLPCL